MLNLFIYNFMYKLDLSQYSINFVVNWYFTTPNIQNNYKKFINYVAYTYI